MADPITNYNQYQKALYFLEKAHDALAIVRDNDPDNTADADEEEEDPMLAGILVAMGYVKAQQEQAGPAGILKRLEKDVIRHMRTAIAAFDTDHSIVRKNMNAAHILFADHLTEWSEDFCTLYNGMLEIYCSYTPMPRGHYRKVSIEIGFTGHSVKRWVNDKIQPPPPTAIELLVRFDVLLHAWNARLSSEPEADQAAI